MSALPNSINYSEAIVSLPDSTKSYTLTSSPINGSVFGPSSVILIDLTRTGFIVPDSFYIRYKNTITSATSAGEIAGCPAYNPFGRFECLVGSQVVETINQANQVWTMLTNLTMDVGAKYGLQSAFGYDTNLANNNLALMDGRRVPLAGESFSISAPLPFCLSSTEKLIPSFAMPQIRLQFTLDSLAEQPAVAGGITNMSLSNFEVCYQVVQMDTAVEEMVRRQGTFYIKSQSYFNTASVLATGTNGSITILYNVQFASIKSIFVHFSGVSSVNKSFDSFDVTSGNGDYSLSIGGLQIPQRPLSTLLNKTSILMELRKTMGSIFGASNSLSINSLEFNRSGNDATTSSEPAKFILGFSCEKLNNPNLLTGISSSGSAILLNINTNSVTLQNYNVNLIVNYDLLLEIDPQNLMVSVKR